ncbi:MAG: phosphatase PAP2 family protein [Bacteroidetes bacterium]|nr:phosphatase PAP2 family protein [Bacteroidota bacterium]
MRSFVFILRSNRSILLLYLIFLLGAGFILAHFGKEQIHLFINRHYSSAGDLLMPWITLLGDGWTITVLILLLFALNRNFSLFTGISCILASGITQLLKHVFFPGDPRPALLFRPDEIRLVPGVENNLFETFPSGHTTLAFAFFICLCIGTDKLWMKFLFFFLALLAGYSRIYLSQHFLEDVYAGSLIGTLSSVTVLSFALHFKKINLPALTFQK